MIAETDAQFALRTQLIDLIGKSLVIDPKSLARREELGTHSLQDAVPYVEQGLSLLRELHDADLAGLSIEKLEELLNEVRNLVRVVGTLMAFNLNESPSPNQTRKFGEERDGLLESIRARYNNLFSLTTPVIAYLRSRETNSDAQSSKLAVKLAEIERIGAEFQEKSEVASQQIQAILDASQSASANIGIAQHAIHFNTQAEEHRSSSKNWLKATIAMVLITMSSTVILILLYTKGQFIAASTAQAIQFTVAKLIFFSMLTFATVLCSRNYKSHQHNYIVNKHRQNALNTFRTFVESTADEGTKNAVLLRATEAIFSPNISGYLGSEQDLPGSGQILEILKPYATKAP